jgi:O-antigen/teichoic acid export membrane protein
VAKGIGHQLAKIAAFSSGLRLLQVGLSLVVSILLTRLLGVDGYGVYAYSVSWVLLLNILASLGCQGLLVREIAANREQEKWGLIRGLLQWTNSIVLLCSLAVVGLFALAVWQVLQTPDPQVLYTLLIALVLIPFTALTIVRQAALQGFKCVLQGQLSEAVIQPLAFIAFLSIAYFFFGDISPPQVMTWKVVSTIISFLFGIWALLRVIPSDVKKAKPEYDTKRWFPSLLSLLFMASIGTIYTRTDTVMLGMMSGTGTVGLYAIALRLANFILMSQQVGASVLGPHIASLYAKGDKKRLQELTTKSIRAVIAYALPVALIFIFFGDRILTIFGSEFSQAHTILIILSIGKLVNVSTGAVSLLLNMTNHERDNAMVVGFSAALNLGLNLLLIPRFGAVGAAIATASASVTANIWLAILVYKRLGISCTVFNRISSAKFMNMN